MPPDGTGRASAAPSDEVEMPPLVEAWLIRRYKRFLADVRLEDGREVTVHCPNPGRMTSAMEAGGRVLLSRSPGAHRKLEHTWELSWCGGTWVIVNTALANRVVHRALSAGAIPEVAGYGDVRREAPTGESRIDFLLTGPDRAPCWLEVKQVSLARRATARFPDAVTARGARHLGELSARVAAGDRAVMLFLVARGDVERFEPAEDVDPDYARALRQAVAAGVELLVYRARVTPERVGLDRPLPFRVDPNEL